MAEYHYATKRVTLPVCGQTAEIREADAFAENLLLAQANAIHRAMPDYWAYLTKKLGDAAPVTRDDILGLRLPDQHSLAIEIHRLSFGDKLTLSGDAAGNIVVDLGELDVIPLPDGVEGPDPLFEFTLPRSGHKLTYGYMTGADELKELELEGFDPSRMSFKAIRSIDGSEKVQLGAVRSWPLWDHKALRADMQRHVCGYDPRVRIPLPNGKTVVINILTDPSFLLPALAG